jgi:hypothetical protein
LPEAAIRAGADELIHPRDLCHKHLTRPHLQLSRPGLRVGPCLLELPPGAVVCGESHDAVSMGSTEKETNNCPK